ncbi:MAG: hypothetical protein R3D80_21040 [Paracoccaceae bacterium]
MTSAPASPRPTIRLRPKTNPRAIRHGFPWVYDNEVVTDRRTKALAPGTIALWKTRRRPLGTVAVTPASRIFARMLDRDPRRRSTGPGSWPGSRGPSPIAKGSTTRLSTG